MRQQRRLFLFCAMVMAAFAADDVISGGRNAARLLVIRALWVVATALLWVALPRVSVGGRGRVVALVGVSAAVCLSACALVRGDHHTNYFAWLLAMPFALVVILRDHVRAVILSGVTTLLGAATILVLSHASPNELVQWLGSMTAAAAVSVYASVQQARLFREESLWEQERADAMERLATANAQLIEAERLAAVGQLAAGVAHEINNPLGSVLANLNYLQEELATPAVDLVDAVMVLKESCVGLRRISQIVDELTSLASEGRSEEPTPGAAAPGAPRRPTKRPDAEAVDSRSSVPLRVGKGIGRA
jgi:signal transduction histidine kinase